MPSLADTPPAPDPVPPPAPQARYRVTFESIWAPDTHPTDFPDNAHYSGLIGGTHADGVIFWQEGSPASEGIQRMAERGAKSPLDTEVMQAIAGGTAEFVLSGPALDTSPGSVGMEFDVTVDFPLVTLVAMVAPSPDWFIGVSGLPLFDGTAWTDDITIALYPFDAGTDSGTTYRSADEQTVPHEPVSRLSGYPVATDGVVPIFGTFTFHRIINDVAQAP